MVGSVSELAATHAPAKHQNKVKFELANFQLHYQIIY